MSVTSLLLLIRYPCMMVTLLEVLSMGQAIDKAREYAHIWRADKETGELVREGPYPVERVQDRVSLWKLDD